MLSANARDGAFAGEARSGSRQENALERVPITWNCVIDNDSLKFKELEHVLIEKFEQLF
jgi:hypothetical protein